MQTSSQQEENASKWSWMLCFWSTLTPCIGICSCASHMQEKRKEFRVSQHAHLNGSELGLTVRKIIRASIWYLAVSISVNELMVVLPDNVKDRDSHGIIRFIPTILGLHNNLTKATKFVSWGFSQCSAPNIRNPHRRRLQHTLSSALSSRVQEKDYYEHC